MNDLNALRLFLDENRMNFFEDLHSDIVDEMLDSRDSHNFEKDWLQVSHEIEHREKLNPLPEPTLAELDKIRETAYKAVFSVTENSDLAAYVSDDFELIGKALALNFNDEWLTRLWSTYLKGSFPH